MRQNFIILSTSLILIVSLSKAQNIYILGDESNDKAGFSVSSAGDVNGDGYDDIIIGAPDAESGTNGDQGISYVVFGRSNFSSISLPFVNGTNGFRIFGDDANDKAGFSVSGAGDVNGDGYDDIIIGAIEAEIGTNVNQGISYVVFGRSTFSSSFSLSAVNGSNGFRILGDDATGFSVSGAGDVDADGYDDIIIGAPEAESGTNGDQGISYVVFGKSNSGFSVSGAGDVDADGYDDIIVGAPFAESTNGDQGISYVIFGKSSFSSSFDLSSINGSNGFRILGDDANDKAGFSVSDAGDVDADGYDDVIIGAPEAETGTNGNQGISYVVFGRSNFSSSFNLSAVSGSNGFRILGDDANDKSGHSVSKAGDINGDGYDDIMIGAPEAEIGTNGDQGISYVVFGKPTFSSSFSLSSIGGSTGFRRLGIDANDKFGYSVSGAGDVNGDCISDIVVGSPYAEIETNGDQGISYVFLGSSNSNSIYGCTNQLACNYDADAICDDDSCILPDGCTNSNACNYDPNADCDDDSCILPDGCTNSSACNYDPNADCNDGSCILPNGCTNSSACNYDPNADCDDGSCLLPDGCTNMSACNYDPNSDCDNGSCVLPDGCNDPDACNFDPAASCNDGGCLYDDECIVCPVNLLFNNSNLIFANTLNQASNEIIIEDNIDIPDISAGTIGDIILRAGNRITINSVMIMPEAGYIVSLEIDDCE